MSATAVALGKRALCASYAHNRPATCSLFTAPPAQCEESDQVSEERTDTNMHKVQVAAPAGVVYGLLADTARWPLYFSPNIHVEQLESDGERKRLRMWCLVGGQLTSWISWLHLDPVERRVEVRQEPAAAGMELLGGSIHVLSKGPANSELELRYNRRVAKDLPDDVAWVERARGVAGRAQLADLKHLSERWTQLDDLMLSCEESIRINGPAELVYDVLFRAGDWPQLVPHITRVDLQEEAPGVHHMTLETLTDHGSEHTAVVRMCFPHAGRIVYKQTTPTTLLAAHTGEWSVLPDEYGVTVLAQHSAVLREENVAAVLGERADIQRARRYVRDELGQKDRILLSHVKEHAENAIRML